MIKEVRCVIMSTLTKEGVTVFVIGAAFGVIMAVVGTWLALKCLAWRGIW